MTFKFHSHNVHLFAYYLSKSDDNLGEYQPDWLWDKCDGIISKTLKPECQFNIKQHLDLENQSEEPWANLNKKFPKTDKYCPIYVQSHGFCFDKNSSKIDSESKTSIVYPVQLYDSYGLGIKLNIPKAQNGQGITPKDIALVNPGNCIILNAQEENEYFLGQTVLITIKLENRYNYKCKSRKDKLQSIAEHYIESLLPDDFRKPPFNRSGYLFGSPIFEYGIIRASKSYKHIIVWFILDDKSEEKFEKYYQQLLDLFFFRAKIIHAYKQIKRMEVAAKNKSKEIQSEIKKTQTKNDNELDLDKLQTLLMELPQFSVEYAEKLRVIKEFQNLIVSNTRNYTDKIYEIKSNFYDEDFSFLEIFTDRACRPFQERVTAAVNFFQLDINLIDNAIDSIRGQVAIEQTHRERQLQTTITSLGIGIAVAGNLASSYEAGVTEKPKQIPFVEKPIKIPFDIPHFATSFTVSMFFGFIAWQAFSRFFSWWYKEEQLTKSRKVKFNLFGFLQSNRNQSDKNN